MSQYQTYSHEEEKEKDSDLVLRTDSHSGSLEDAPTSKLQPNEGYDPEFVKRTMRKVDWRLIPILGALYSISLVDRTNISLAAVSGMTVELELNVGSRYSIALLLFFVSYIIFEMFSNIFLRKFGAAFWLSVSAVSFGAITIGLGFIQSWISLAICRVLLGIFEAAVFPGCVYLTSCWYIRSEMQVRLTSFYMTSVMVTGFSSIWAYGCTQIEVNGMSPWRWIFIIMGIVTVIIGVIAYFAVVDFPDQAKFLSEEQKEFVKTRIDRDRGDAVFDPLTWKKAGNYALDLKLWAFAFCFGISTIASYALSYFLPLILRSFGFSVALSQILVAPPYVFAVLLALITAKFSDKTGYRSPFIVFNALLVIAGLAMARWVEPGNVAGRYAGIFLAAAGCNSNVAATLGQASVNIVGQSKRAYVSALQVAFGGIGGIIASVVFRSQDSPLYTMGMWVAIGAQILLLLIQLALVLYFVFRNNSARRGGAPVENTPGYFHQY